MKSSGMGFTSQQHSSKSLSYSKVFKKLSKLVLLVVFIGTLIGGGMYVYQSQRKNVYYCDTFDGIFPPLFCYISFSILFVFMFYLYLFKKK